MIKNSIFEKEKPTLDSDANTKLDNEIENRSGNDRRKDFDRRSQVGRRRSSSDRRRRKQR
jgi:hypothetical protein